MKKLLALLLALVMLLSLAACSSADDEDEDEETTEATEETKETEETEETGETEETEETEENLTNNGEVRSDDYGYTVVEGLEDVVLVDDEYMTITLVDMETDSFYNAPIFNLTVTNNTDDNLSLDIAETAINGMMVSAWSYVDVAANEEVAFTLDTYDEISGDVMSLNLRLYAINEDYEKVDSALVAVYPEGEDAYDRTAPEYEAAQVLLDQEDIYMGILGLEEDDYWDTLNLVHYVYNGTSLVLDIGSEICAINSLGFYSYNSVAVLPGCYSLLETDIDLEEMALYGIEEPTAITLQVDVYDMDIWEQLFSDTFTYYPQGEDAAEEYVYTSDSDDIVVLDEGGIKMTYAFTVENLYTNTLYFYLENETGTPLYGSLESLLINGETMTYPWMSGWSSLAINSFLTIEVYNSDLEELEIEKIDTVQFEITVYDDNSFDELYTGTVEFSMP